MKGHWLGVLDLEWEVLVDFGNMIADGETGQKGKSADVSYERGIGGCNFWKNPMDHSSFESCQYHSHQIGQVSRSSKGLRSQIRGT